MNLHTFVQALEEILPPATAMKGDRIGLQLQSGRIKISRLLLTMEVTDSVADEAIERNADCIVSFHPLIFSSLTTLQETERVGRICTRLIQHNIALIVAHTNFDSYAHGTSSIIAEKLGFHKESFLVPDGQHEGFGMGIVALLNAPLSMLQLAEHVRATLHSPVRFGNGKYTDSQEMVRRVAIVGGSGASFIDDAILVQADAFITADIKYHDFHRTQGIIGLVDVGHYEMEQFVPEGLEKVVRIICQQEASELVIMRSECVPNPIRYVPNGAEYQAAQAHVLKSSALQEE
ncbi:MAG: Nif3-like dinuclear metal center hexameric protein [Candidatus Kapaibacterium sp.]|nr:MAG: Nif3-like dinuclear metal center hexameric protein [Candidatus Kapabacteria bacterium]